MPIPVTCEQCGRTYRVADDKAGLQFHCKQCGSPVLIPSASQPADPQSADPQSADPQPDDAGDDEYGNPVPPRLIRPPKSTVRPTVRTVGKQGARTAASKRSPDVPEDAPRRKIGGLTIWGWIALLCSIAFASVVALCVGVFVMFRPERPPSWPARPCGRWSTRP